MNFDDILVEIGEFGPYQKLKYFLLCLTAITAGCHALIAIFITAIPAHRCQIPGYLGDTYAMQNDNHSQALEEGIPSFYINDTCQIEYSKCDISYNNSACSSWVYDQSTFTDTVITEFNLVCGKETFKSLSQTIFMVGLLWGSFVFGSLSDFIGRKKTLMIAIVFGITSGFATAFAPEIYSFIVFRMFVGAAVMGTYMTAYVMGIEIVGPSKRLWAGGWLNVFWAIGAAAMCGVAYGIRDWSNLQIAITAPIVLFLVYWWLIPESPRWLLSKGRNEEAMEIIKEIAIKNKKAIPNMALDPTGVAEKDGAIQRVNAVQPVKPWEMFTSPVLFIRSMIIFWNWIVVTMVFYGLSLNSGNLAGDIYLNSFLSFFVELPAYIFCIIFWDRLGRRLIQVGSMLLGGVACVCTIIPVLVGSSDCEGFSLQTVTLVLSLIGKLGASAAFATVYIYSAELYPTVIRSSAMGTCSMLARIGGMVSPFIADLGIYVPGKIGQILPLLIFGVCSLTAGLLSLLLPETLNQKLPDTIEDAKQFGRKVKTTSNEAQQAQPLEEKPVKEKYIYTNPSFTD